MSEDRLNPIVRELLMSAFTAICFAVAFTAGQIALEERSCGWIEATSSGDNKRVYVNLGLASAIYPNGTVNGKASEAVVWHDHTPTGLNETPSELVAKCGGK
jgi:hypothetical protein